MTTEVAKISYSAPLTESVKTSAAGSSYVNSVFPASQAGSTSSVESNESKLLLDMTGMSKAEFANVSEDELKKLKEILDKAVKDTPKVNGEIDWTAVEKTAKKYYIAVRTGWTIEGYKKANAKSAESLGERIERFFGLKKGSFAKLSQEQVQNYLERYFNNYFVEKLKSAKTQEEKEKIYKTQLQDFGKLLTNTPDEEKAIFKQAITALVVSNRIKGLDATLDSFASQEARSKWADSWTVEEEKALALTPDIEGHTLKQEEVTVGTAKLAAQRTETGSAVHHEELEKSVTKFFEDNKEALERIARKEANGEELTEEEKQLKKERDNFYTAAQAGEISGTAINQVISAQAKEELLNTMNKDAFEHPNYKEVLTQVEKFVEEHPEELTASKEEIVKILDKATNGNYTKVATQSAEPMAKPASVQEKSGSTELVNKRPQQEIVALQQSVAESRADIKAKSDEGSTNFFVEKSEKVSTAQVYKMENNAIRSASNINEYLDVTGQTKSEFAQVVFKNFDKAGTTTQLWATNFFSNMSTATQKLFAQGLANSRSAILAIAKDVDLSKFDLIGVSVTTQKQIDRIQDMKA